MLTTLNFGFFRFSSYTTMVDDRLTIIIGIHKNIKGGGYR